MLMTTPGDGRASTSPMLCNNNGIRLHVRKQGSSEAEMLLRPPQKYDRNRCAITRSFLELQGPAVVEQEDDQLQSENSIRNTRQVGRVEFPS